MCKEAGETYPSTKTAPEEEETCSGVAVGL